MGANPAAKQKALVRALAPADLDDVVELHRQGFGERAARQDIRDLLGDVFFGHPWIDDRALPRLSVAADAFARAALPGSPVHTRVIAGRDDDLEVGLLLDLIERQTRNASLGPVYDEETLFWLLEMLRKTRLDQEPRASEVRAEGKAIGWYIYYSRPGRVGRVLQMGSAFGSRIHVLEHLFSDAVREGNVGSSGQSDPTWTDALAAASCRTRPGRTWLLAYTANPRVKNALAGSDAFFSRLEGEAWLHFGF